MVSTAPDDVAPPGTIKTGAHGRAAHFLPHLQGLRAIAVLLVVIYHVWPGRLTGGYVGVDVFFVISGFLISGQLVREIDATGTVRLGRFWAKRARRLLPASLLVLIVSALLALAFLPVSMLPDTVREILASVFYVENWALAANAVDYLATTDPSIAQHYWSLSLEEQFYVLWPLILIAAGWLGVKLAKRMPEARARRTLTVTVVAVITAISFGLSVWLTAILPGASYFTTYTRMWEFGVGALLALVPALMPRRVWLSNLLGFAGVAIVLGTGWFYDQNTVFPGSAAALPVIGTAMAIAGGAGSRWFDAGGVLGSRIPRFFGDISYSLYLWHWPLIIAAPYVPFWGLEWYHRVALIPIAIVLAWLTKRFVEDPFRIWPRLAAPDVRARRTLVASLAMMGLAAASVGVLALARTPEYDREAAQLAAVIDQQPECFGAAAGPLDQASGAPSCDNADLGDAIIPSPGFANADKPDHTECLTQMTDATLKSCTFGATDAGALRVVLVGDSHAYQLLDSMIALADAEGWSLTTYMKGGCAFNAVPVARADLWGQACRGYQAELADTLANGGADGTGFDVVVTAAIATQVYESAAEVGSPEYVAEVAAGFETAWAGVAGTDGVAGSARVVAIKDNPGFEEDPNQCLRQVSGAVQARSECARPRADALVDPDPIAIAGADAGAQLIDLSDTYCDAETCFPVVGGANVFRDPDHLTNTWVATMQPLILAAVEEARTTPQSR